MADNLIDSFAALKTKQWYRGPSVAALDEQGKRLYFRTADLAARLCLNGESMVLFDAGGYVRVKIAEGKGKWKLEHVLVMERVLGRPIRPGEIVHHIDGTRSHNDESNLHLCRNHAEHMWLEKQIKGLFREMIRRGIVTFNRKLGVYECQ